MDVEVTLGPEDLKALKAYLHPSGGIPSTILVALSAGLWLLFGCGGCLNLISAAGPSEGVGHLVLGAILFGFGIVGGAAATWLYMRVPVLREALLVRAAFDRFVKAPYRLTISPEGVAVEAAHASASYGWPYFSDLVQTGDHVFLFTGGSAALIVPRRAFATDQAFLTFAESCRRFFDHPPLPARDTSVTHPTGIKTRPDEFTHGSPNR